jgi:hypothetical protein
MSQGLYNQLSIVEPGDPRWNNYNGLKKLDRNLITLKFLSNEKIKTKIHC